MTDTAGSTSDEAATDRDGGIDTAGADRDGTDADLESLREEVDRKYDFDNFGPSDMAKMTAEEWDAAFDPDTWITGEKLLTRVEAELKTRIARREIFGVFERAEEDGDTRLVVYSDEGYAVVYPNGDVRGRGTVLRDVEPTVALCSMESYEVTDPPDDWSLPDPDAISSGSGELGNWMMQAIAGAQLIAAVVLFGAWLFFDVDTLVAPAMGLLFLLASLFLFSTVANARLSDRFRSAEYRDRLQALEAAEQRPEFPPLGGSDRSADDVDDR